MIKVVLLGSGNVAHHFFNALISASGVQLVQTYSRNLSPFSDIGPNVPHTNNLKELRSADVYVIAIKDEAIAEFSGKLKHLRGIVVHTSGSMPMHRLDPQLRRGVVYPVQTLSLHRNIEFRKVPLAIESEHEGDRLILSELAHKLSDEVYELSSEKREKLHLAAVFANNFSNYMFIQASELCLENDIPFDILKPMILETGKKVLELDPVDAQTGPARRNDQEVIDKHLRDLKGTRKEIYGLLSKEITKLYQNQESNHGKKL